MKLLWPTRPRLRLRPGTEVAPAGRSQNDGGSASAGSCFDVHGECCEQSRSTLTMIIMDFAKHPSQGFFDIQLLQRMTDDFRDDRGTFPYDGREGWSNKKLRAR